MFKYPIPSLKEVLRTKIPQNVPSIRSATRVKVFESPTTGSLKEQKNENYNPSVSSVTRV